MLVGKFGLFATFINYIGFCGGKQFRISELCFFQLSGSSVWGEGQSIHVFLPSGYRSTESDGPVAIWNKRVDPLKQNYLKGSLSEEKEGEQKNKQEQDIQDLFTVTLYLRDVSSHGFVSQNCYLGFRYNNNNNKLIETCG